VSRDDSKDVARSDERSKHRPSHRRCRGDAGVSRALAHSSQSRWELTAGACCRALPCLLGSGLLVRTRRRGQRVTAVTPCPLRRVRTRVCGTLPPWGSVPHTLRYLRYLPHRPPPPPHQHGRASLPSPYGQGRTLALISCQPDEVSMPFPPSEKSVHRAI